MSRLIKFFSVGFIFVFFLESIFSQSITTAGDYFKTVSEYYGTIKDYEAVVEIKADKQDMMGTVSYKRPNLLRIDFSNPKEQTIVFNGDSLTIYLHDYSAILRQQVQSGGGMGGANLATASGLSLLSRYYVVAYETGQTPVPLEKGTDEMVMKLVLNRRNTSEAFRFIKLAINAETKLIRRVQAVTTRGESFTFDFLDYKLNQSISEQRFIYDPPSSANNFNNFLFSE